MSNRNLESSGVVRRRRDARAGLYVHVPFCDRVCPYCDFAVTSVRDVPHEAYADALLEEWEARKGALEGRVVRSIYFGGGTPSRWSPQALARVLGVWREALGGGVEEITLECNPADVTPEHIEQWREAGIDRVSLGVQSFDDEVLAFLGRNHDGAHALRAARMWLEAGVNLSVDLIYGSVAHREEVWRKDLDTIEALHEEGLRHVSTYHLTIEQGTPFARRVARGESTLQSVSSAVAQVEVLRERLARCGIRPYEVSSWSELGQESVHNSSYWMGAEYLGLGMGAHSLRIDERGVFRRQNSRTLAGYLDEPSGQGSSELVDWEDHLDERLFVGVRSIFGVSIEEVTHQFGLSEKQVAELCRRVELLRGQGFLLQREDVVSPTWEGMQVADGVGEMLVGGY